MNSPAPGEQEPMRDLINTIICGDCLEVMRDWPDNCIEAVITDPPYSSGGQYRGDRALPVATKYVQTESKDTCRDDFAGDNRDQRSFLLWCNLWMSQCRRLTKPGGIILTFTDWRQLPTMTDAIQCGGWVWRNIATWWKPGIRMQRGRFSSSAEYIVYGSNGPVNEGECSPQNVFTCRGVPGKDKRHIAEKPLEVLELLIGLTPKGSTIIDPFCGSGVTCLVAKVMGRNYIGIDISPEYCEIARKRIEAADKGITVKELERGQQVLF